MERSELHPVEVLLLTAVLVIEAVLTVLRLLVLPLLALVVVLLTPRRQPAPQPAPVPAQLALPPVSLATIATELQALPSAELRRLAGTRRKASKRELTALICAMPI